MYKLTKLQIEDGKDSMLPTGYETAGDTLSIFKYDVDDSMKELENLTDLEEGCQVYLSRGVFHYHNTSKIKEIIEVSKDEAIFRTQTSLYQLTKEE